MLRSTIILSLLIVIISGCSNSSSNPEAGQKDDLGREVSVHTPVHRIASLAPSITEMVFAAGAEKALVGVTVADDFPLAVRKLPAISTWPLDYEGLSRLKPDLAIASDQINSTRDAENLSGVGIPTYFIKSGTLEHVFRGIETIGRLAGTEPIAKRNAAQLRRRVQDLKTRTDRVARRPSVIVLVSDVTLFSFGEGSYVHDIITLGGGTSATAGLSGAAPVLSDEFVLATDPDYIIVLLGNGYGTERLKASKPSWKNLRAIRMGQVVGMDPSLLSRPGPRLVDAAYHLAALFHPEVLMQPASAR